jgi:hypothetical protein
MSKFLLNLLVQISKAFVYSKIQILFGNNFSSDSGPSGPSSSSLGIFAKRRLFFEFAQSINGVSSLSRRCQVGPTRQIHPLPRAGRPESCLHRASPQLIAPHLPASIIEIPIKAPYSPALIHPLESPLTPPRPSMASTVNRRPLLTGISTPSSRDPL